MYTDLHLHTYYSDGEYSPLNLIELARLEKATIIAITDHNNLEGAKKAIANNRHNDLLIIPGVEFSAKSEPNINIHILGYNIDLDNVEINKLANAYREDAKNQVKSLLQLLKSEYGIVFKISSIEPIFSRPGNIGRPEVAKLLVKEGFAANVEDAFKRLLNPVKGRQAKKQVNPTAEELIKCILAAGGIPCLAHPESLKMSNEELSRYIKELMSYGLEAIEVYHSKNSPALIAELEKITDEYGLLRSVGSDYHGPIVTPDVRIRHGLCDNLNKEHVSILDKIMEGKRNE